MNWPTQNVMRSISELARPDGGVKHDDIVEGTGLTGKQVSSACAKFVAAGYLRREKYADKSVKPGCYKLTALGLIALKDGARLTSGPKGPTGKPKVCVNSLRERAWRVLRIRRKASVPELAGLLLDAGTGDAEVERAQNNLNKYLRQLARAGYLCEMRREAPQSATSNGAKRYLLVRDTGPLPPIPQPTQGKVFDQNEEKQYDASSKKK